VPDINTLAYLLTYSKKYILTLLPGSLPFDRWLHSWLNDASETQPPYYLLIMSPQETG